MIAPGVQQVTQADFEAFIALPENRERTFEFINGEIVEVPSNPFVSVIAGLILYAIRRWLEQTGRPGYVTGAGGGYIVDGQVFAPDVAYIPTLPSSQGFEPNPPELAVEVISDPHNNVEQTDLRRKLASYRRAGVVVWVVDYVARTVEAHHPQAGVQLVRVDGTLSGGDVLPGFSVPVNDIFPEAPASSTSPA